MLALRGHGSRVTAVVFSPDGRFLASGDYAGVVKVWAAAPLTPELRRRQADLLPELRREREAAALRSLAEKMLLRDEVLTTLRANAQAPEPVRRRALAMAEGYRENPVALNNEAWPIAAKPDAHAATYGKALRYAEAACRLLPDKGEHLNTLGAGTGPGSTRRPSTRCAAPTS